MCKVTRYSSIEKHSMCPDNEGQFILYTDYKNMETKLNYLESTLRDIANINAWMDSDDGYGNNYSWRGWGRGFYAIPEEDEKEFEEKITRANLMTYRTDENSNLVKVETVYSEEYVEELHDKIDDLEQSNDNLINLLSIRDNTNQLLIKIAEESMDESSRKWISVKERLPETNYDVLVYLVCHLDNGLSGVDIGAYFSQKNAWAYADNTAHEYNLLRTEVTHWMDMPSKPKDIV